MLQLIYFSGLWLVYVSQATSLQSSHVSVLKLSSLNPKFNLLLSPAHRSTTGAPIGRLQRSPSKFAQTGFVGGKHAKRQNHFRNNKFSFNQDPFASLWGSIFVVFWNDLVCFKKNAEINFRLQGELEAQISLYLQTTWWQQFSAIFFLQILPIFYNLLCVCW